MDEMNEIDELNNAIMTKMDKSRVIFIKWPRLMNGGVSCNNNELYKVFSVDSLTNVDSLIARKFFCGIVDKIEWQISGAIQTDKA